MEKSQRHSIGFVVSGKKKDEAQLLLEADTKQNEITVKLKELNVSFNYVLHYAPQGENLHFHIEVLPRISTWAGFEFCSGIIINSVSPEDAAEFYKK